MGQVLAEDDLGRAAAGIEDEFHAAVTPAMGSDSRNIGGELVALGGDIIAGGKIGEGLAVVLPEGVNHPGDGVEAGWIGEPVVEELLGGSRIAAQQAGQ